MILHIVKCDQLFDRVISFRMLLHEVRNDLFLLVLDSNIFEEKLYTHILWDSVSFTTAYVLSSEH